MRGLLGLIEQKILLNVIEIIVNYCYDLYVQCLKEFFIFELVNEIQSGLLERRSLESDKILFSFFVKKKRFFGN
jgi:hypothetical protein